jgi:hypothetical protein
MKGILLVRWLAPGIYDCSSVITGQGASASTLARGSARKMCCHPGRLMGTHHDQIGTALLCEIRNGGCWRTTGNPSKRGSLLKMRLRNRTAEPGFGNAARLSPKAVAAGDST